MSGLLANWMHHMRPWIQFDGAGFNNCVLNGMLSPMCDLWIQCSFSMYNLHCRLYFEWERMPTDYLMRGVRHKQRKHKHNQWVLVLWVRSRVDYQRNMPSVRPELPEVHTIKCKPMHVMQPGLLFSAINFNHFRHGDSFGLWNMRRVLHWMLIVQWPFQLQCLSKRLYHRRYTRRNKSANLCRMRPALCSMLPRSRNLHFVYQWIHFHWIQLCIQFLLYLQHRLRSISKSIL